MLLPIRPQGEEAKSRLKARVSAMCRGSSSGMSALLLVDNAEDALQGPEQQALPDLLQELLAASQGLLVVVTSRVPLPAQGSAGSAPSHTVHVQPVGLAHMQALVQKLVPSEVLEVEEAAQVAQACGGVPLLTRLAADALANGRISLQVGGCIGIGVAAQSCESLATFARVFSNNHNYPFPPPHFHHRTC